MMKLELIMLLLPVVFMLHEYEEIIMFRHWLDRNRDELKRRFPRFEQFLAHRGHFDYSTATFAIGTAHEFILISLISFCAVWLDAYQLVRSICRVFPPPYVSNSGRRKDREY